MPRTDAVLPVYIGWDAREAIAADVCMASILRRSSSAVYVRMLKREPLEYAGLYRRKSFRRGAQMIDALDGRPFSTDFSFSRFLVPALAGYDGWALFVDCDFLFLDDIAKLFEMADDRYAAMCVHHQHEPREGLKMDGVAQTRYRRKNWSSLVLWNCGHAANRLLTPERVNTEAGGWLHGFDWLSDDQIGALDPGWNWISGTPSATAEPRAVHFTEGGPWFQNYQDVPYAAAWRAELAKEAGHA